MPIVEPCNHMDSMQNSISSPPTPIPKKERYVNHILFLSRCISENVIPNSLKLELELTIGNHDETFQNIGMNNCSNIR